MTNKELAKIFYEIAQFLAIEEVAFKPAAYEKAAFSLETLEEDVREIYQQGGGKAIEKIPGIGKSIAEKIIEYLETGRIKYYEEYKKKYPFDLEELTAVEGIGPKIARDLYKYLKIRNLADLERAAREGKIRNLPHFGEQSEKNILEGIRFLKRSKGRFLLGEILPRVREIEQELSRLKEIKKLSVCGSVRRMKETIGDVDFLAVTKEPKKVMDFFCSLPEVIKIWGKGATKSSVRFKEGFDVDLRLVSEEAFGAALQYFTGSKEHNIKLRRIALEKGFKLNEYGLFRGSRRLGGKTEEEIYHFLGMSCPAPELREDRGEVEAARRSFLRQSPGLPCLIELKDIKGDLHCHSDWDGGEDSLEELAEEAIKRGYQYLGIADHTKFLKIENGLDEKRLLEEHKAIEAINQKYEKAAVNFRLLHGCEANILNDGSLDIKEEKVLEKLDYVIAGIHSNFKISREEMTARMIRAMKNPFVKIISHPTGRLLKKRDEYQIDIDKILRAAKETKTALEINSFPQRLDLNDFNVKKAVEEGVRLFINTDAHRRSQLGFMEYGVSVARRGWAEKKDILNSRPFKDLLKILRQK